MSVVSKKCILVNFHAANLWYVNIVIGVLDY